MMATRRPVSSAAARIRLTTSAWWENSPCEKFSRATFSPAQINRRSISGLSDAGPIVATIFVLFAGKIVVIMA